MYVSGLTINVLEGTVEFQHASSETLIKIIIFCENRSILYEGRTGRGREGSKEIERTKL
jgi:hypothetical protein